MIKKINILLVLLLLLVSITAVSAVDDTNDTVISDEPMGSSLEKSNEIDMMSNEEILSSNSHIVNKNNYNDYFNYKTGELNSSSVKSGDIINLDGDFEGVNFNFKIPVNIVGTSTIDLKKSTITLYEGASGSSISNLKIVNTENFMYGVFLNGATNCSVTGCFINNTGQSSYAICLGNNANYNNVTNNNFHTYGITYGHGTRSTTPVLLSGSHYNYIANNNISCDDANAIYLSSFDGGPLKGGASTFNNIYNNTIKYNVLPTSWSYGIQIMGGNNRINSNTVIGSYRGISTSGSNNVIINNRIINLTGADYGNLGVEVGGEIAIVGSYNSTIINNTIENAKILASGCGISALDYSLVENNTVDVRLRGTGILPQGSYVTIKNNNISTAYGSGILFNTYSFNLTVIGNNIVSQHGVGILIQKLSSKRMPGNITIVNNRISVGTADTYAIDARDADSSTVNYIFNNTVSPKGSKVATPEGEFDPSKPVYNFNGTTYRITPENLNDYISVNGAFKSDIKDGDIINFEGEFSNMVLFVNAAVKISGKDAIFYNTTFKIYSNSVWLENLVIRNNQTNRLNAWGVLVYRVFGATIRDCDIEVTDPNAAYAIYVVESSDIDVINNTLYSSGNYLTYTLLAHTVEDCKFINNTIRTVGTGNLYINSGGDTCIDGSENCLDGNENCLDGNENCLDGNENCLDGSENCVDGSENCLDGDTCFDGNHVVKEVYRTYGILLLYSSNNIISGNKVNATSKLNRTINVTNSTNSIVGIDLYYNSHNNIFSNNEVFVKANDNYIYGMGVLGYYTGHNAPEGQGASNNKFINNSIVLEGTYFVQGLVIGDESEDTLLSKNSVVAKSNCVSYGVNLEMSQKTTIQDNNFILNSDVVYGIESVSSDDNIIENNEFEINAKQAYGFIFSNSINNDIISNLIFVNATGEELMFKNFDSLGSGVAGIYLKSNSSNNKIKSNNITSLKGYAIIIDNVANNNLIADNYLNSEKGVGNSAINNTENNIISNNYIYLISGKLEGINVKYFENSIFVFTSEDISLDGAIVEFYIKDESVGNATVDGGVASLKYGFINWIPKNYEISAKVSKLDYKTEIFTAILEISNGTLNVTVNNVTGAINRNAVFTAVIKNILGNGISGIGVDFYVVDEGYSQYLGKAVTNDEGLATLTTEIPQVYDNISEIRVEINNPNYFESTTAKAYLMAYKLTSTFIQVNPTAYPGGAFAILKDEKGNAVSNKKVSVKIGNNAYEATTNSLGVINIPILAKGKYVAVVTFEGDEQYYSSKNSTQILILSSISDNKDSAVYFGNTVQYKVRVIGSDGKYGAGNLVMIKINGHTYKVYSDSNGYATQSVKLGVGTYTITAEFNGDVVSNKITFKPTLTAKNIVKKKAKKVKFSVNVVDKNGKPVKNKKVTFKIIGKSYKVKTNKKGKATLTIKNLKVGKYTITSSYGGCTIKNTIKIKK